MAIVILSVVCAILCIVCIALCIFVKKTLDSNIRLYDECAGAKIKVEEMLTLNYNNVNEIRSALHKVDVSVGVIKECQIKTSDFNKRIGRLERKLKTK